MKKLFFAVAAVLLFTLWKAPLGYADDSIRLYFNTKQLQPEVPPKIVDGNTLVPVRIISEELGAKVGWNAAERKITIEKSGLSIQLTVGSMDAVVNAKSYTLPAAPIIVDGSTLLPVRFVSEHMGLKVNWDDLTRSVFLYRPEDFAAASGAESSQDKDKDKAASTAPPAESGGANADKPVSAAPADNRNDAAKAGDAAAESSGATETKQSASEAQPSAAALPEVHGITLDGDQLRIQASGPIKGNLIYLDNPERLVINVPYAALGKKINGKDSVQNGEVAVTGQGEAVKVRYALFSNDPSTVRIVVDLKQKIEYNLLEDKSSSEIVVSLKAQRYRVVLDAGHGGHDSGAVSVRGLYEKDFNLSLVKKIAAILEKEPSIDVRLTRKDDTFVELDDRVAFANELKANVFVSVHANKYSKPSVRGIETYYGRDESLDLAALLHSRLLESAGFPDRNVRKADFRVIKYTSMPAVLLECGYLSNEQEEADLFDESLQNRVAAAIAAGIKEYLQIP